MIPQAHQLPNQPSPFIDSGVHLDLLTRSPSNILVQPHHHQHHHQMSNEADDDVFIIDGAGAPDDIHVLTSSSSVDSSSSSSTVVMDQSASNGLCRSRRSHFSRKDSTPEMANKVKSESEQCLRLCCDDLNNLFFFLRNRWATNYSHNEVSLVVLREFAVVQGFAE